MSQQDKKVVFSVGAVIAVLIVVAVVFFIAATMVTDESGESEESNARMQEKVAENIAPVGQVYIGEAPAPAAAPAVAEGPRSGDDIYNASCAACHNSGAAGAPKIGDKGAWDARVAQGSEAMLANAVNGINAMPPKGTCASCSNEDLQAAIEYMLQQTGY